MPSEIFTKFLKLSEQKSISQIDIDEVLLSIDRKGFDQVLYRQKMEIISSFLNSASDSIKRKRNVKETSLEISKELRKVYESDLTYIRETGPQADIKLTAEARVISADNVVKIIKNLIIPKRRISTELTLESFVAEQLTLIFGKENVYRQYNVGGFLALKIDIDLGNGLVGIELKIVDNLNATDMQRLIGQLVYYKNRFYNKNNIILFIAGKAAIDGKTKELLSFVENLGGIHVIYSEGILF